MADDPAIEAGRAAWARIRERGKSSFDDWIEVGRMLIEARSLCMRQAGANSVQHPAYRRLIREWLEQNDLGDSDSTERRNAIVMIEHLTEIEKWRAKLTDVEQRRCNHPNSIVLHWRRGTRPTAPGPKTHTHTAKAARPKGHGRAIHWPQEAIKRAAQAMGEKRSSDLFVLARVALEAAIRNEADLYALIDDRPVGTYHPRKAIAAPIEEHAT